MKLTTLITMTSILLLQACTTQPSPRDESSLDHQKWEPVNKYYMQENKGF